jgi:hypothetical protein
MQGKSALLPGEICRQAGNGNPDREIRLRRQKSAEAIVPPPSGWEGPNIKETETFEQIEG